MPRKRATERQVIEVLIVQGAVVPCYRCRVAFQTGDVIEREHLHELALGGSDTPDNWRYSHKTCHDEVTNGTKATTAGSSKHKIAKANRLAKGPKKRKGRKIPSRPFPKRSKK